MGFVVNGLEAKAKDGPAQGIVFAGFAGQRFEDFHRDGVDLALAIEDAVHDVIGAAGEHVHQEFSAAQELGHAIHGELAVAMDVCRELGGGEQQGLFRGLIKGNGHWGWDIKNPRCANSEGFGERN